MAYTCVFCESDLPDRRFTAREMMFGMRDKFEYIECSRCKSLQIATIPDASEVSKYYPPDYYSFATTSQKIGVRTRVRLQLRRHVARQLVGMNDPLGWAILKLTDRKPEALESIKAAKIDRSDAILDVGCGAGSLLDTLALIGFKNLLGIDPFIQGDLQTTNGVSIIKSTLDNVQGSFDAIMLHHSLEHVPDPIGTVAKARKILRPDGVCLLRLPTTSSDVWEKYGVDWVELDAPRHFAIPSRDGMKALAELTGFRLERVLDDTTGFEFWASELYKRDIPLNEGRRRSDQVFPFDRKAMRTFDALAKDANRRGRAGRTAFILRAA